MTDTRCNATNNERIYFEGTNQLSHSRYLAGTAEREWKLHDLNHPQSRIASKRKHSMSWINSEIKLVFLFRGDPSRALDPDSACSRCMSMKGGGGASTTTLSCPPSPPHPLAVIGPYCTLLWTNQGRQHAPHPVCAETAQAEPRQPSSVCSVAAAMVRRASRR